MNEHQRINQTNYNTVRIDRKLNRDLGFRGPRWRRRARGRSVGEGPRNPYKTSGRREMRALLLSLRTFELSSTHPRGNREARRKAAKAVISGARLDSKKRESISPVWDMRLWWHSPHHQIIPRGFLKNLDGTLPEDFRD